MVWGKAQKYPLIHQVNVKYLTGSKIRSLCNSNCLKIVYSDVMYQ